MSSVASESLYKLGDALRLRGHLSEAVAQFQEALRLKPEYPEAYAGLGQVLAAQGRGAEAVLCYRRALRLNPNLAEVHRHLGDELKSLSGTPYDDVIASYREAVRLDPDDASAHYKLANALRRVGLLDEAIAVFQRACELRPDSAKFHSGLLYCLHFHPGYDEASLAREHERWNERHARPLAPVGHAYPNAPDPDRRIRVGFVSPHFRIHPVGRFLLPLFEGYDRRHFEFVCYASVARHDGLTKRFRAHSDGWHDTAGVTDENLAELVRQDRIDILVDLDCHMPGNRLLTFARKPAPLQVTYLAYCSTTGVRAIDYRLTDPFLDPVERPRFYAEESAWLSESYWCYEPHASLPPVGPLPASARGYVTFGCLNSFCKVTEPTFTAWRDLLREVPGLKLVLHATPGTHRDRVLAFFAAGGVDADRVEFMGMSQPLQYFRRYLEIDIALDPFPYGGGTTTCDALWMGVPVITVAGQTAVGRGGASILSNVGLPELVAQTPAEQVRLSVELAADLPRLASLRAGLRDRMLASPLTDAPRFARSVETQLRAMWRRWCDRADLVTSG